MEKVGKSWGKLAKAGKRWPKLTIVGKFWQNLPKVGRGWSVQSVDSGWHKLSEERWGLVGQKDHDRVVDGVYGSQVPQPILGRYIHVSQGSCQGNVGIGMPT